MTDSASGQWDAHWDTLDSRRSVFSLAAIAVRRLIFQPAVAFYARQYFAPQGIFVEMGCGTAESSALIPHGSRQLIGLDFSAAALKAARQVGCLGSLVRGDILAIPCRPQSLDGIWNLGVMEHLLLPEIGRCLTEFHRVLKPGGVLLLFWPTERNLSRWVLAPIEKIRTRVTGRSFVFFPDEVSRVRSKEDTRKLLAEHGFKVLRTDFSARTAFIHMVIVAVKTR